MDRCLSCGRFISKQQSLKGGGYCENDAPDDEDARRVMAMEAELDPSGPAAFGLYGDESMLRRGYS